MIEALRSLAIWIDKRVHVTSMWNATAGHLIPRSAASWFYVFGSATLLCFVVQIITGICLALIYQPTASEAFDSLEYLTFVAPLGWFLRGLHYWGSNFMVAIMVMHMAQVFLFGAYKYPREMTWVSGVILSLLTLGMAFSGQVLRWDQDAYWGLGIGVSILGRVPVIGPELVHWMLGAPIIAGETLNRFFTLHVFVIPGAILALVALHLRLVLTKGINEYPEKGKKVYKETYMQEYDEECHKKGIPFVPDGVDKDLVFAGLVLALMVLCTLIFGPKGPEGYPDPTLIRSNPRPDWPFLWIFAVASLLPEWMETFGLLVAPPVAILLLLVLPFIDNTGEKKWTRRPLSVLSVVLIAISLVTLTWFGATSPWSPQMEAWSKDPTPASYLKGRTPLEIQGALVLQSKQCRNCHELKGSGGLRGPSLSGVGDRLDRDQLIRQVIQGGGNMPAYGKNLTPAEVEALVAFMQTLHPRNEPDAHSPEHSSESESVKTAGL